MTPTAEGETRQAGDRGEEVMRQAGDVNSEEGDEAGR